MSIAVHGWFLSMISHQESRRRTLWKSCFLVCLRFCYIADLSLKAQRKHCISRPTLEPFPPHHNSYARFHSTTRSTLAHLLYVSLSCIVLPLQSIVWLDVFLHSRWVESQADLNIIKTPSPGKYVRLPLSLSWPTFHRNRR
ncbi:hypothetical protein K469DRAFT_162600 [Zopfia rhizophila CBS 207.26]|uniref:Uncharacterized protein n=1 Tax=Zopfia rhizophila CBS 207.26 TaxID=1314779 RepID=A0A6A6E6Y6_9PEZI|nr:hypothetical protein K469DRAFT_162600 [Zopfia rhizophila CBS 207.26]